jgi:hypothetical protein
MFNSRPLKPGIYRHYKGNRYEVIGIGKDTETEEDVVIYRPLYESDVAYWVRPYEMFIGEAVVDGVSVARFTKVESDE